MISSPRPDREQIAQIIRGGSWAGYTVFLFVFMFFFELLCFVFVYLCCLLLFVCFRLVFLSFCIYNRNKNTYTNIKKKNIKKLKGKQTTHKKQKSPSQNLRYIYSRSGRGLEILYVCCLFYVFLWVFMFLLLALYVFLFYVFS